MADDYCKNIILLFILFFVIGINSLCLADEAKDYFMKGYAYININQPEEAIELFSKAIALSPAYSAAYRERGFAYYLKSMHIKAIIDFRKAIELNSQDALAWNNLGLAYHAMRLVTLSKQAISNAIDLSDDYAQAHLNLAHIYWLEGETDVFSNEILAKIRYHLKEYVRLAPEAKANKEVQKKIRWVDERIESGNVIVAAENEKNANLSPKNMSHTKKWVHDKLSEDLLEKEHITLGVMFLRGEFLKPAIDEFEKVVAINRKNANAYMILGAIHLKMGNPDEAISNYAAALAIDPRSEDGNFGLGKAYLYSDNILKAKQQIEILKQRSSILGITLEEEIKAANAKKGK